MGYPIVRRSAWLLVLMFAALALSACTGGSSRAATLAGASWPGITVNEDIAYVAFQTGVYAVDLESCESSNCEVIWNYSAVSNRRSLLGGRAPVQFYAEPAFDDKMVVVGDYAETLHAIDAETGEPLWTFSTERARFIGGATLGDGVVYAGSVDGNLYALDAESGDLLWSFHADSEIWDSPLLDGDVLYLSSLDHRLYAIDAQNGHALWEFAADGALVGTPTLDDGVLYFGAFDKHVYAVNTEDGALLWKREVNDWVWDGPAVTDGVLIVGDLGGSVYGLNSEDGSDAWEQVVTTGGPVVSTPLIEDGTAYVGSGDSNVYALDVETGAEARQPVSLQTTFTRKLVGLDTGTSVRQVPIYGHLIPYGSKLLIGLQQGDELLQALDLESGQLAWSMAPTGSTSVASTSTQGEEEEQPTAGQQLLRWLPLYLLMTLLMLLLLRRRPTQ